MKRIFSIITAALIIMTLLCSCGKKEDDAGIYIPPIRTDGKVNYETVHATIGTLKEEISIEGQFTTPYRTDLMFTLTGGTIESINVHIDQEVTAGEVIATLSSDEIEEQLTVQEIKLNSAKSTYDALAASHASSEDLEFAQIAVDLEQLEYDRLTDMKENLTLKAPFDGRIVSIEDYYVGSYIGQNVPFCTISDSSRYCLTATDYNNVLKNVSFGTKVDIKQGTLAETTGKVVDTIVSEITIRDADNHRQTVPVNSYVIECDDDDAQFLDLGGIEVIFTTVRRDDAVIVPYQAVFEATDDVTNLTGTYVNILLGGIKVQTPVTVGIVTGTGEDVRAEITSGLDGTETLILR